ncbi:Uncharacterised protein [uncultured Clostridium sp.]|nr:Uncharacterised protein [uncultured Clostridium sp.]
MLLLWAMLFLKPHGPRILSGSFSPHSSSRVHRRGIFRISSGPYLSSYLAARAFFPAASLCPRHPKSIGEGSFASPPGHTFPQTPRPALSFRQLLPAPVIPSPSARDLSHLLWAMLFLKPRGPRPFTHSFPHVPTGCFPPPPPVIPGPSARDLSHLLWAMLFLKPRSSQLSPPSAVRPQSSTPVSGLFTMGFCRSKRDSISTFAPASLLRANAVITSNTW